MIANLMHVAGVNHVITIDLHASQMQGFFKCPVDNLVAEPLLAKWIRNNIRDWQNAVVVSKNPGGTKRVTSLADALKLSFGIITTDQRRPNLPSSMYNSVVFHSTTFDGPVREARGQAIAEEEAEAQLDLGEPATPVEHDYTPHSDNYKPSEYLDGAPDGFPRRPGGNKQRAVTSLMPNVVNRLANGVSHHLPSPLAQSIRPDSAGSDSRRPSDALQRMHTALGASNARKSVHGQSADEGGDHDDDEEFNDEVRTISSQLQELMLTNMLSAHVMSSPVD